MLTGTSFNCSGFGYKKDDPSTWKVENLPVISEKGSESRREALDDGEIFSLINLKPTVIMHYGISHEDWVWKVRCEPGVVGAFEKWVYRLPSHSRQLLTLASCVQGLQHRRPHRLL